MVDNPSGDPTSGTSSQQVSQAIDEQRRQLGNLEHRVNVSPASGQPISEELNAFAHTQAAKLQAVASDLESGQISVQQASDQVKLIGNATEELTRHAYHLTNEINDATAAGRVDDAIHYKTQLAYTSNNTADNLSRQLHAVTGTEPAGDIAKIQQGGESLVARTTKDKGLFKPVDADKLAQNLLPGQILNHGRIPTAQSLDDAAKRLSSNDLDPTISAIIDHHVPSGASAADKVTAIRTNPALRNDLGGYFIDKIETNVDALPDRIVRNAEKRPNATGYTTEMTSREYTSHLALSKLDGTFKNETGAREPVEIRGGKVIIGQHRGAADMLLKPDLKSPPVFLSEPVHGVAVPGSAEVKVPTPEGSDPLAKFSPVKKTELATSANKPDLGVGGKPPIENTPEPPKLQPADLQHVIAKSDLGGDSIAQGPGLESGKVAGEARYARGQTVKVVRSGGVVDDGWVVMDENPDGTYVVGKTVDGEFSTKKATTRGLDLANDYPAGARIGGGDLSGSGLVDKPSPVGRADFNVRPPDPHQYAMPSRTDVLSGESIVEPRDAPHLAVVSASGVADGELASSSQTSLADRTSPLRGKAGSIIDKITPKTGTGGGLSAIDDLDLRRTPSISTSTAGKTVKGSLAEGIKEKGSPWAGSDVVDSEPGVSKASAVLDEAKAKTGTVKSAVSGAKAKIKTASPSSASDFFDLDSGKVAGGAKAKTSATISKIGDSLNSGKAKISSISESAIAAGSADDATIGAKAAAGALKFAPKIAKGALRVAGPVGGAVMVYQFLADPGDLAKDGYIQVAGQSVKTGPSQSNLAGDVGKALTKGMGPGWQPVMGKSASGGMITDTKTSKLVAAKAVTGYERDLYDSRGNVVGTQKVDIDTMQMAQKGSGSPYKTPQKGSASLFSELYSSPLSGKALTTGKSDEISKKLGVSEKTTAKAKTVNNVFDNHPIASRAVPAPTSAHSQAGNVHTTNKTPTVATEKSSVSDDRFGNHPVGSYTSPAPTSSIKQPADWNAHGDGQIASDGRVNGSGTVRFTDGQSVIYKNGKIVEYMDKPAPPPLVISHPYMPPSNPTTQSSTAVHPEAKPSVGVNTPKLPEPETKPLGIDNTKRAAGTEGAPKLDSNYAEPVASKSYSFTDNKGRDVTITTTATGAKIEQVAGHSAYQISGPTQAPVVPTSGGLNAFRQEESYGTTEPQAPLKQPEVVTPGTIIRPGQAAVVEDSVAPAPQTSPTLSSTPETASGAGLASAQAYYNTAMNKSSDMMAPTVTPIPLPASQPTPTPALTPTVSPTPFVNPTAITLPAPTPTDTPAAIMSGFDTTRPAHIGGGKSIAF